MRCLGTGLIVACLIADMATPLCPGAFRFDPAQSIDAVGSRTVVAPLMHVDAASPEGHELADTAWSRPQRQAGSNFVARVSIRPILPRAALASIRFDFSSPRTTEDG